jgi:hypothetical protein
MSIGRKTLPKRFTYYNDPGHGWLAVKRKLAQSIMGEQFMEISPYSYQKGDTIYLEEDCDMHRFLECVKNGGIAYVICHKHTNKYSPIRRYNSFHPLLL